MNKMPERVKKDQSFKSIDHEIVFYETKINQYLNVMIATEKGKECSIHINNINTWNDYVRVLKEVKELRTKKN